MEEEKADEEGRRNEEGATNIVTCGVVLWWCGGDSNALLPASLPCVCVCVCARQKDRIAGWMGDYSYNGGFTRSNGSSNGPKSCQTVRLIVYQTSYILHTRLRLTSSPPASRMPLDTELLSVNKVK